MSAAPLIVLAAGGTGGHVIPAEALAVVLLARGYRLALVTDRRGAAYGGVLGGLEIHRLPVSQIGGGPVQRLRGGVDLLRGYMRARVLLPRIAPQAVIGFGGYPSLPTVLAATRARIPTAIHEQNAVFGRANRFLAARVDAIALSFPEIRRLRPADAKRAVVTGNPVRAAVIALHDQGYVAPRQGEPLRLIVIGGSQGASVFGSVVPAALAMLEDDARRRIEIAQQCRPEDMEAVRAAYRAAGIAAHVSTFYADLPERLARAHLVICRAGASTLAELTVAGRPAILVPYPHAMDDHQTANAGALVAAGGGWLMAQSGFTPSTLSARLAGIIEDPALLARAAAAAKAAGRPDAAERLADLVARLAPAIAAPSPRSSPGTGEEEDIAASNLRPAGEKMAAISPREDALRGCEVEAAA